MLTNFRATRQVKIYIIPWFSIFKAPSLNLIFRMFLTPGAPEYQLSFYLQEILAIFFNTTQTSREGLLNYPKGEITKGVIVMSLRFSRLTGSLGCVAAA